MKNIPDGAPVPGDQSLVRDAPYLAVVGRVRSRVSLASAQAELGGLAGHLARTYPATNAEAGVRLEPLRSALVRDSGTMLIVLLAAVIVLLVIASVNVANLLLARGSARERELAVRHTLGASRRVLVRQMLVECLLLSAVSGLLGVAVAAWGVDVLVALAPADLPRFEEIHLDARALVFTVLVSVVTGAWCSDRGRRSARRDPTLRWRCVEPAARPWRASSGGRCRRSSARSWRSRRC